MVKRWFRDRHNGNKVWEVTKLSGGNYYVKQFINGNQYGRGLRIHKWLIDDIGMMEEDEAIENGYVTLKVICEEA